MICNEDFDEHVTYGNKTAVQIPVHVFKSEKVDFMEDMQINCLNF